MTWGHPRFFQALGPRDKMLQSLPPHTLPWPVCSQGSNLRHPQTPQTDTNIIIHLYHHIWSIWKLRKLQPGPAARRTYQHGKHAHCLSAFVPSKTLCLPKSQGDLLCQGQQIDPSDVRRLKTSISWPLPLSGLLMSSHGLKKPLMLANKDAIPSTVMPMM